MTPRGWGSSTFCAGGAGRRGRKVCDINYLLRLGRGGDKLRASMSNTIDQTETRQRAQAAKEYLIAQIVEEAREENIPLSEVERKMLYFTESEETLPDIWDVSGQFEKECDCEEYEAKIS